MGLFNRLSEENKKREMVAKELEKRRGKSATYTQPLVGNNIEQQEDIKSFLLEFYSSIIFDKAYEMKQLLTTYADTLGIHYKLLVPNTISYDEFWSRYYYRCSTTTILYELNTSQQDEKHIRDSISKSITASKLQTEFMKHEIERGLGSRTSVSTASLEKNNNNNNNTNTPTTIEEKIAARALAFHKEAELDITETSDEDVTEIDDDNNADAIGIGFAASG